MTFRYLLATSALILASSANAAVITKKYKLESFFSSGSSATVTSIFEYSLDPDVHQSAKLLSFTTDGNSSFQVTPSVYYIYQGYGRLLTIGDSKPSYMIGKSEDFQITLSLQGNGDAKSASTMYTSLDKENFTVASKNILTDLSATAVASAVPEPATWALMLAGFGLTGAALRRRRLGARRVLA